jgi:hypothetical protein
MIIGILVETILAHFMIAETAVRGISEGVDLLQDDHLSLMTHIPLVRQLSPMY